VTARGRAQEGGLPVLELARLRQAAYRVLGAVFLYPRADTLLRLAPVAVELLVASRQLSSFAFWGVWERLLASLAALDAPAAAGLEPAYAATFAVTSDGTSCFPCESAYFPPDAAGWVLAELEREYGRAGFQMALSSGEAPDHVAVELDFMSLLCGQEGEGWRRKQVGEAVERLDQEAGFLERHLGRWFPVLAGRVAKRGDSAFYGLATDCARTFIAHDLGLVTALLDRYREVARR
jgi:TorA maturation chaperone TorD